MLDRQRLLKLMMMTQSANDAEALIALRKANAMLKDDGKDWSNLLGTSAQIEILKARAAARPAPPPPPKRKPSGPMGRGTSEAAARFDRPKSRFTDADIPRILQSLLDHDTKGYFRDFLQSLQDQWNEKHYLTERQYEVVMNAYEREK